MRTYFRSLSDVLGSPLAQTAQTFSPRHAGGHRVLKSTKLEDAAYRDLRRGDNELDALEKACGEKLSTFPALSRDIYQSFYSLNVRRQPEDAISEQARRFNAPILNEVMDGEDYLGRLKELMDGKRKNGYAYGRGEKYSLELGGDINRAIASEFAMLAAPETLPLFLRKLQRKALKQYQRREPICKGSGDIICMLDESSSAESQAPWCKAVALALLDIAMRDQRRFAVIHFAGVGDVQTDLFLPGQYDREDVLRCAETFLNGNTDYETPLREALRLMEQEGFENADMVFVTDGECVLPDSFLEKLKAEQSARGFQITGILLDQEDAGFEFSLREFCTNVYRTSQLSRDQIAEQLVVSRVA